MKENKIDDRKYTVYMHTSPSNKRYIGITSQKPPTRRWRNDGSGYKHNTHFWRAIQKYGWDNFKHEILYSGLTKEEAELKEVELIILHKSDNHNFGYNIDHGGNSVGKMAEKTKEKLKELFSIPVCQYSKHGDFIEEYSSMTKAEEYTGLSASSISKCCRNEAKLCGDSIWRFKGDTPNSKLINWCNSREPSSRRIGVSQYDRYGCLVKEYESMTIAHEETGVDLASIIKCCKCEQGIAGGFIWRYSDEPLTKEHLNSCISILPKRIVQYTKCGEFIEIYETAVECELVTGVNARSILSCCSGDRKTAGGYLWRNEGEELTEEYIQWCNTRKVDFYRGFSGKMVAQYTMDGVFLAIYKSIAEAEQVTGVKHSNISSCCNKHRKQAGNYIWKFVSDIQDPIAPLFPTISAPSISLLEAV